MSWTDDAAILSQNYQSKKEEVISELDDLERKDIIDLLLMRIQQVD
jgi:hypothetical protein